MTTREYGDDGCRCEVLDPTTEGGGTDPRWCPEHAYEAGRRQMAELIVYRLRTDYPMNRHATEWADWIEGTLMREALSASAIDTEVSVLYEERDAAIARAEKAEAELSLAKRVVEEARHYLPISAEVLRSYDRADIACANATTYQRRAEQAEAEEERWRSVAEAAERRISRALALLQTGAYDATKINEAIAVLRGTGF